MFGTLGGPEIFLILVIALIIFGPRKLPEIGRSVGNMMNEFRRASNEFRRTVEEEVEADKHRALAAPVAGPATPAERATAPGPLPGTIAVGDAEPAAPAAEAAPEPGPEAPAAAGEGVPPRAEPSAEPPAADR